MKRIIYFDIDKHTGEKIITNVSAPTNSVAKAQLQFAKNYMIIDDNKFDEREFIKSKRKKGKQHIHHWDEENQKIVTEYKDLPYEEMTLEDKVDYLYNQLQTLLNDRHHKNISETDE